MPAVGDRDEREGWERSDFPIVCEDCLGPNPYIRMQKQHYGAECAISGRPFTGVSRSKNASIVHQKKGKKERKNLRLLNAFDAIAVFRWKPGNDARYKKTVISRDMALAKNVCQVCLLDLDTGLPVQVRDTALGKDTEGGGSGVGNAHSTVMSEYNTDRLSEQIAEGNYENTDYGNAPGKQAAQSSFVQKMARNKPYYKKNKAKICTFWLRNACTRPDCPFRPCNGDTDMPELSSDPEMRKQNISDRYHGNNDPVAKKMMRKQTQDTGKTFAENVQAEHKRRE